MAIAATITKIVKDPDATVVDVLYTDNVSFKTQKEYRLTSFNLANFKQIVLAQIGLFGEVDNVDKVIAVGPFDPSPTPPTSDEQKRIDYAKAIQTFNQMNRAILANVKKTSDQDYIDLQSYLAANFIDSYVNLF